jgi:hypothetical protein
MPQVNPRAPDPHHVAPGSRRTCQQQPSEPSSVAGDEFPDRSGQPSTTSQAIESTNPTGEPDTEHATATGRLPGGGTRADHRTQGRQGTTRTSTASGQPDSRTA